MKSNGDVISMFKKLLTKSRKRTREEASLSDDEIVTGN